MCIATVATSSALTNSAPAIKLDSPSASALARIFRSLPINTGMTLVSDFAPGLLLEGGTVVLGAAFQNAGAINNLTNLGATLSGNYTVTGAYTWAAGSLSGSLTVASNAVLNLVSGGNLNFPPSSLT